MRTLVCLSGLVRNVAPFVESFGRHVLDRLPAAPDLVGHFPTPASDALAPLLERTAHATTRFEDDPDLGDVSRFERNAGKQIHGARGNLLQWTSMARCADLKDEREAQTGRYDLVLWTRPDLYFMTDLDPLDTIPADTLYVPAHDSWGGIMDRFCFGPSDVVGRRMRILDHFEGGFFEARIRPDDAPPWNAEHVYRHYVETTLGCQIAFSRIVTGRVRDVAGTYEVVRPRCKHRKNRYDVKLDEPSFQRTLRRLDGLAWEHNRNAIGQSELRLPLTVVAAEIDRPPGVLGR